MGCGKPLTLVWSWVWILILFWGEQVIGGGIGKKNLLTYLHHSCYQFIVLPLSSQYGYQYQISVFSWYHCKECCFFSSPGVSARKDPPRFQRDMALSFLSCESWPIVAAWGQLSLVETSSIMQRIDWCSTKCECNSKRKTVLDFVSLNN